MIRLTQVKLPLTYSEEDLKNKCAGLLRIQPAQIKKAELIRRSVDARKKPEIIYSCVVDVMVEREKTVLKNSRCKQAELVKRETYHFPRQCAGNLPAPIVIVGMGPAGLFCGYLLAEAGYRPILLERGQDVDSRKAAVETFWKTGVLNPDSNVQFGEGGAGAFSDGKLNTTIKDQGGRIRKVLEIFVENGAPEDILYEAKPHIGTDILSLVVKNMRKRILSWGGQVRFESCVTDILIEKNRVTGVEINGTERLSCSALVLAVGHSARDTFSLLLQKNISMEPKPFAVGFRVIHPQKLINRSQYGVDAHEILGAAPYKLTARTSSGRGVYTFCMCPGGYVVNASSEPGHTVVNGMSYHGRSGEFANSAVIVTVGEQDYDGQDALAGMRFQRELEKRAYELGQGAVPVERYGEFCEAVNKGKAGSTQIQGSVQAEQADRNCWKADAEKSGSLREDSNDSMIQFHEPAANDMGLTSKYVRGKTVTADLTQILPVEPNHAFIEGMERFEKIIPGFAGTSTLLCGVESRTSSPVRIVRDDSLQSVTVSGLYPCGEGAGYAGGIVSAAADGMRVAEMVAGKI